ncbi:MAG: AmmeMemoRadiSam system protein B [Mariprofundales bacterium]
MASNHIRSPAVAGLFYPHNPAAIHTLLDPLLKPATASQGSSPRPRALIVPHAGHSYCAAIAACAFRLLRGHHYRRVAIVCPTHRVAVAGAAIPTVDAFATPLGQIPLDAAALAQLTQHPEIVGSDEAHRQEHAIEVLLPFLQLLLEDFMLIPIAAGEVTANLLADALTELWRDEKTLLIISSDLSHFLPYETARHADAATCAAITHGRPIDHDHACGATGINALQILRQRTIVAGSPAPIALLDYCNSGDTAGDRNSVVGYASFVVT